MGVEDSLLMGLGFLWGGGGEENVFKSDVVMVYKSANLPEPTELCT